MTRMSVVSSGGYSRIGRLLRRQPLAMALFLSVSTTAVFLYTLIGISSDGDDHDIRNVFILTLIAVSFNFILIHQGLTLQRQIRSLTCERDNWTIALNNMRDGIVAFDAEQRLIVVNRRYQEIYQLPDELIQAGTPFSKIVDRLRETRPGMPPTAQFIDDLLARLREGRLDPIHVATRDLVVEVSYRPRPDGGWISTHEDVTERSRIERKLKHLAHYDSLTDLANRVLLREELEKALIRAENGDAFAVLCLDLDRFKSVNDTLGHAVGDALLKEVAQRLRDCTGQRDVVARMGGDEFTIILTDHPPTSAANVAAKIVNAISAPFRIDSHHISIGTSIGIAIAPADGMNSEQLLRRADFALYRGKSDGRGTYKFFEHGMDRRMHDRQQLKSDLRDALGKGQFELEYQAVLNLNSYEVHALEALVFWNHPAYGRLMPAQFMRIAEETSLILQIGEWVLRQACAECAGWPDHIGVAVNISSAQLNSPTLQTTVLSALSASGLRPNRLELDIREAALLQVQEAAFARIRQLRSIGIRFALAEFGAGHSLWSYLCGGQLDEIKLAPSLSSPLDESHSGQPMLRTIADLASNRNIAITVSGIETEDQLKSICCEGISNVQGPLISPPKPVNDLKKMFFPSIKNSSSA